MNIVSVMQNSRRTFLLALGLSMLPINTPAMTLAGLELPQRIHVTPQQPLQLNGAGVRTKFIYDIYVAALYLEQTSNDSRQILNNDGAKRIALHFIYDEVSAEKLLEGWKDGFRLNNTRQQLQQLQQRFEQSQHLFRTVHAGDTIYIDYLPGQGTRVSINDQVTGMIPGADFYQAALKVWLGEHPAQQAMKQGMLGDADID